MRLNEIAAEFGEKMDFYCVYIQEAHPQDGWQVDSNLRDDVIYNTPTTIEERADLAQTCVLRLEMAMPTLLDDMNDTVDTLYNGLPERLYVLDADHTVFWTVSYTHLRAHETG